MSGQHNAGLFGFKNSAVRLMANVTQVVQPFAAIGKSFSAFHHGATAVSSLSAGVGTVALLEHAGVNPPLAMLGVALVSFPPMAVGGVGMVRNALHAYRIRNVPLNLRNNDALLDTARSLAEHGISKAGVNAADYNFGARQALKGKTLDPSWTSARLDGYKEASRVGAIHGQESLKTFAATCQSTFDSTQSVAESTQDTSAPDVAVTLTAAPNAPPALEGRALVMGIDQVGERRTGHEEVGAGPDVEEQSVEIVSAADAEATVGSDLTGQTGNPEVEDNDIGGYSAPDSAEASTGVDDARRLGAVSGGENLSIEARNTESNFESRGAEPLHEVPSEIAPTEREESAGGPLSESSKTEIGSHPITGEEASDASIEDQPGLEVQELDSPDKSDHQPVMEQYEGQPQEGVESPVQAPDIESKNTAQAGSENPLESDMSVEPEIGGEVTSTGDSRALGPVGVTTAGPAPQESGLVPAQVSDQGAMTAPPTPTSAPPAPEPSTASAQVPAPAASTPEPAPELAAPELAPTPDLADAPAPPVPGHTTPPAAEPAPSPAPPAPAPAPEPNLAPPAPKFEPDQNDMEPNF